MLLFQEEVLGFAIIFSRGSGIHKRSRSAVWSLCGILFILLDILTLHLARPVFLPGHHELDSSSELASLLPLPPILPRPLPFLGDSLWLRVAVLSPVVPLLAARGGASHRTPLPVLRQSHHRASLLRNLRPSCFCFLTV